MKTYAISFSAHIHDKATTYPEVKPVDVTIRENLPANTDPHKYLRARIAEELNRAFANLSTAIENFDGEAPDSDPLA